MSDTDTLLAQALALVNEDQAAARAIMEAFRENERHRLCAVCGQPFALMVFGADGQWRCEHHDTLRKQQTLEAGATQLSLLADEPRQEANPAARAAFNSPARG